MAEKYTARPPKTPLWPYLDARSELQVQRGLMGSGCALRNFCWYDVLDGSTFFTPLVPQGVRALGSFRSQAQQFHSTRLTGLEVGLLSVGPSCSSAGTVHALALGRGLSIS